MQHPGSQMVTPVRLQTSSKGKQVTKYSNRRAAAVGSSAAGDASEQAKRCEYDVVASSAASTADGDADAQHADQRRGDSKAAAGSQVASAQPCRALQKQLPASTSAAAFDDWVASDAASAAAGFDKAASIKSAAWSAASTAVKRRLKAHEVAQTPVPAKRVKHQPATSALC